MYTEAGEQRANDATANAMIANPDLEREVQRLGLRFLAHLEVNEDEEGTWLDVTYTINGLRVGPCDFAKVAAGLATITTECDVQAALEDLL